MTLTGTGLYGAASGAGWRRGAAGGGPRYTATWSRRRTQARIRSREVPELSISSGRLLDRSEVAHAVALGEVAEISRWYEQIRIVVAADGPGGRAVHVTGELASGTAAYLDAVLEYQVAARPARLVVDLSEVSFLGVRGVAVLARAAERARDRSLPLAV